MSVLAHVILGGNLQNEPAATQAFAFILNQEPEMVRTFTRMLSEIDIKFEPGRVVAEKVKEENRLDLTIHDSEGQERIFIENKFWAGLTRTQPLNYLDKLPETNSALVFIVPEQRMPTIWNELKLRCEDDQRNFNSIHEEGNIFRARVDDKNLLITSWNHVLGQLSEKADSNGYERVKRDIQQLCGLTERMDQEAFLPLLANEVSDQQSARRVINFIDLINTITEKLKSEGIADANGLRSAGSYKDFWLGRYFRLHKRFPVWLGLAFNQWKLWGTTPLWLTLEWSKNKNDWSDGEPDYQIIRKILKGTLIYNETGSEYLYIPIMLQAGTERESVIDHAVTQISTIANRLREEYP